MDETLVSKMVEESDELVLCELLVQMTRYNMPFLMFPDAEWTRLEKDLKDAINKQYPGAIDWDDAFPKVTKKDLEVAIVPRYIKEKYIRCFIYSVEHS